MPSPEKAQDYSNFVPFTARMMAALRAQESARADALFHDPFAAQLAGESAFQAVTQQLTAKDQAYVAVRTHFFDTFLLDASLTQVVILAAGLDTRSFRLSWPSGTRVYELDYPEVLAFKASLLQDAVPKCDRTTLAADLTQVWAPQLIEKGFDPNQPTVWLIEGLLMYFSADQAHTLLQALTQLSAPGSHLGLDLVNEASLDYGPYRGYFQSGWDHPEAFLGEYGWEAKVVQPGDPEAHFDRYTWVFPPREQPGVERVFLITAHR